VIVVSQEAIAVKSPVVAGCDLAKQLNEEHAIAVRDEDRLLPVPPIEDVIDPAGNE
jgi:hypothetical protein